MCEQQAERSIVEESSWEIVRAMVLGRGDGQHNILHVSAELDKVAKLWNVPKARTGELLPIIDGVMQRLLFLPSRDFLETVYMWAKAGKRATGNGDWQPDKEMVETLNTVKMATVLRRQSFDQAAFKVMVDRGATEINLDHNYRVMAVFSPDDGVIPWIFHDSQGHGRKPKFERVRDPSFLAGLLVKAGG